MNIYRTDTDKAVSRFVYDLNCAAMADGFLIHNESTMEMAHGLHHPGSVRGLVS